MNDLDALAARLTVLGSAGVLPVSGAERLAATARSGISLGETLRLHGAPLALARVLERAGAPDEVAALSRVLEPWTRAQVHSRQLSRAVFYPLATCVLNVLVAGLVYGVELPALRSLATFTGAAVPAPLLFSGLLAFSLAGMLYLAAAMVSERPLFPFAQPRARLARMLVVRVAAALAQAKVPLDRAFEAAALSVSHAGTQASAQALAARLRTGTATGTNERLLGPLGTALFLAAAARGAGHASLSALAARAEARARAEAGWTVMRVHLFGMLWAGLGLSAVGAAFYWTYFRVVVG